MNNSILEDYCSFEVSKLLKDKGFGVKTKEYYRNYLTATIMKWDNGFSINGNNDDKMETAGGMTYVSCPTHSLAIKWIAENYNVHIFLTPYTNRNKVLYESHIYKHAYAYSGVSKAEAESAALLYTLKNLIK